MPGLQSIPAKAALIIRNSFVTQTSLPDSPVRDDEFALSQMIVRGFLHQMGFMEMILA